MADKNVVDVQRLVGRTIVKAERDPPSSDPWPYEDQSLTLTLDDGTEWYFSGWGHDASGLEISVEEAK
jgi:hypothetical protein